MPQDHPRPCQLAGDGLFAWTVFLVVAALLLAAGAARADSLVGYWPLDGDAEAAAGTGGTLVGGPVPTADRRGNPRGAMAFDAAQQQHCLIPGGGGLNGLAGGTLSLWVKWEGHKQGGRLADTVYGAVLGRQKNGHWSSNLIGLTGPDPDSATIRWRAGYRYGQSLDGTTPPGAGTWRHVAVVFTAGRHVLYVDGKLEASQAEAHPLDNDPQVPLSIGAWIGDGASYATAAIDDLAIWNVPLGADQIAALAKGTVSPPEIVPDPLAAAAIVSVNTGSPALDKALWIWDAPEAITAGVPMCYFRKTFELSAAPNSASVLVTVDNDYDLYVNGSQVGGDGGSEAVYWKSIETYDVTKLLRRGRNVLAVAGRCLGGAAGLLAAATVEMPDGTTLVVRTDGTWQTRLLPDTNWNRPDYDDSAWRPAAVLGPIGVGVWGDVLYPGPVSPGRTTRPDRGQISEGGPDFAWPAGVVFVRGFVPLDPTGFGPIWIPGTRAYYELDHPAPAALGRQLAALVPARPDGELRVLCDAGGGLIGSPAVDYDGRTVYFSMVAEGEKFFHVWRIAADGSGLEAVTGGPFHDFDPQPLPDGRILFTSTRTGSRDEYHGNVASSLFALEPSSGRIRPFTYHIVGDHEARVTASGSVAFIRRDNFIERAKVETRIHHTRPDGTGGTIVLGADRRAIGYDPATAAEGNSAWLRQYGFGSPAPLPDGRIAAISHRGLVASGLLDSAEAKPEQIPAAFVPFDVAPLPDGRLVCTAPGHNWLGVLDPGGGDVTFVYGGGHVHSVVYLGPRPRPPVIASHVDPARADRLDKTGYLVCQSVFHTKQTEAELRRIKAIRVYEGRPFTLRSVRHSLVHLGVEGVELGTVPVAPDGSFSCRVPADRALAIQAVDAEGRGVINELTWIYVRPGERRTCVGCHSPRPAAPAARVRGLALRAKPLALLGQGDAHRYRANNAGNGGVVNLQLDRFREAASINLYRQGPLGADAIDRPLPPGRPAEVARLCRGLVEPRDDVKIASARRLALFRDRAAVPTLVAALDEPRAEVRTAVALAISACGNRDAVDGLLRAIDDEHPAVAQAADVALENLTGHSVGLNAFEPGGAEEGARRWREWLATNDWPAIEARLIARLEGDDPVHVQRAVEALGHCGGEAARAALRAYLAEHRDGRLRIGMAAMRALGHLKDEAAVPLLAQILADNAVKDPGPSPDLAELGWLQKPGYLAATAAEALGRIGTPDAEKVLVDAWPELLDFWIYTWRTGDHDWLRGCHSSVVHYRILEGLDAMGSINLRPLVPGVLRSVPIDPDRALLYENDAYETIAARVVQRAGMQAAVLETCLAVLGNPGARPVEPLRAAVTASPPAREVKPQSAETRAAQLASVVCLDRRRAPQLRAALERYRAREPSRTRSWVCFFLVRTLGKLEDRGSVDLLLSMLRDDPPEASFGFEDPPHVFIYKAMTPFHRAAAADALGRIGDRRAVPTLLAVAGDFDNAISVRHAAATALGSLCDRSALPELEALAGDYPEIATRRALLEACRRAATRRAERAVANTE